MAYSLPAVQLAMQICTLTYVDENSKASKQQMIDGINAGLKSAGYAEWSVVWGPALDRDRSNLVYVAANGTAPQFVIGARGTVWSFWLDWLEDFDAFLPLTSYSRFGVPVGPNIQISEGTAIGLDVLLGLDDGAGDLKSFVTSLPPAAEITVTGHSLGGCLAAALSPCVATWRGGAANTNVFTFAAPSPGNNDFAEYFNQLFRVPGTAEASTAHRFYNSLDVVPNAWSSLPLVETYYPPRLPCPSAVKHLVNFAARYVGSNYAQLGTVANSSAVKLSGSFINPLGLDAATSGISPVDDTLFLLEVEQQHHPITYQRLLNMPPVSAATAKLRRIGAKIGPAPG
jgi:hypothetical protein